MKLLDDYLELQKRIFEHFGYVEGWRVLPLEDARGYYWRVDGEGPGEVLFADNEEDLSTENGNHYVNEIYTQRHLPKWVYRADGYTLIVVDTHTDSNQLLKVFDNSRERPVKEER